MYLLTVEETMLKKKKHLNHNRCFQYSLSLFGTTAAGREYIDEDVLPTQGGIWHKHAINCVYLHTFYTQNFTIKLGEH